MFIDAFKMHQNKKKCFKKDIKTKQKQIIVIFWQSYYDKGDIYKQNTQKHCSNDIQMKFRHRKLGLPLGKHATQVIQNRIKLPLQVIEDICSLWVELLRVTHAHTHAHAHTHGKKC